MKREDFTKFCRYYKGEKECPAEKSESYGFWLWEKLWVEEEIKGVPFSHFRYEDVDSGVIPTPVPEGQNTPARLLTILFQYYLASKAVHKKEDPAKESYQKGFLRFLDAYYYRTLDLKQLAFNDYP